MTVSFTFSWLFVRIEHYGQEWGNNFTEARPECPEIRCVLDAHKGGSHYDGQTSWSYT